MNAKKTSECYLHLWQPHFRSIKQCRSVRSATLAPFTRILQLICLCKGSSSHTVGATLPLKAVCRRSKSFRTSILVNLCCSNRSKELLSLPRPRQVSQLREEPLTRTGKGTRRQCQHLLSALSLVHTQETCLLVPTMVAS